MDGPIIDELSDLTAEFKFSSSKFGQIAIG